MQLKCIIEIIQINTILRIVICFQGRHQGAVKGLWSSISGNRGGEQEQYPSIPDSIGRNEKSTIVDSRRANHDEVQSVTAVKRFCRKRVAVYPLHTFVLGVSQNQTTWIVQSKMSPTSGWFLQLQPLKKRIYLTK